MSKPEKYNVFLINTEFMMIKAIFILAQLQVKERLESKFKKDKIMRIVRWDRGRFLWVTVKVEINTEKMNMKFSASAKWL